MQKIVKIYLWTYCPYCIGAKKLLESKNIAFEEIVLDGKDDELRALREKTHHRTEKDFTQIHQSSTGNHQFNLPSRAPDDRQIFMFAGSHDYAQRTRSCDADVGMGNDAQRPNPRARN